MFELWLQTTKHTFHFQSRYISIGRDRRCSLVLPDRSVKPVHIVLHGGDGRLWLERKNPSAVTFLNYAALDGSVELFNGDVLNIGLWTLIVQSRELRRRMACTEHTGQHRTSWGRPALTPEQIERWRTAGDSAGTIVTL